MQVDKSIIEKFGFTLEKEQFIQELQAQALLLRHVKTNARLLSLHNDDENKVFGINFRTPPSDSTGIAHIMEHSVLCGSEKYPAKEPFVELMKGSLNTFLNAFTYPDKTCYPVASQVNEDFYNLVDVYLDAVFFPLITPATLAQEGWHLEFAGEGEERELIYKGVVFNEMKGAYSSPLSLMYQHSKAHLYPDTTYQYSSGGDPAQIPQLTFEQFKEFHDTFYHPSNAWIYFYGDSSLEGRLAKLDEYLSRFDRLAVNSEVGLQMPFSAPREFVYPYDAGGEGESANKTMVTVNWLLPEGRDMELVMALSVLDYILLGSSAAPLEKALIDSGLGESVIGGGLSTELRQMNFSVGLKNISRDSAAKVQGLILDTLQSLVDHGIPQASIEAALNTVEFSLRENNTGRYPRGLSLMLRALTRWLHDEEPFAELAYESSLEAVKARSQQAGYFESLIEQYLLKNYHRVMVTLEPQQGLADQQQADENARLKKLLAELNERQLQQIAEEARQLQEQQERADDPAVLATIPSLKVEQLDRHARQIATQFDELDGAQLLSHDLFCNGVGYFDLAFDVTSLNAEQIAYLPIFCTALFQMGTHKRDFVDLVQMIDKSTGGVYASPWIIARKDEALAKAYIIIRGKVLRGKEQVLMDIIHEVLAEIKLDQQDRFLQLVRQRKAGLEGRVISEGHAYASIWLGGMFSQAGWLTEQLEGLAQLFFVRELEQQVINNWSGVLHTLNSIRDVVFCRSGFLANITMAGNEQHLARSALTAFVKRLPEKNLAERPDWPKTVGAARHVGAIIPSMVNYVARGGNLYDHDYVYHGSVNVVSRYLKSSYLWDKVRVQGGAYGAMCSFSRQTGFFSLCSYRDPNFAATLGVYHAAADFLLDQPVSQIELDKNIIGTIGDLDSYQLPDAKGMTAFGRYLRGISEEDIQLEREQVFETTSAHVHDFGRCLQSLMSSSWVAAFGPEASFAESPVKIEPLKLF